MSFIFDALRKSENERQRGSVPDVARLPLAEPERRMPRWALSLIALLAVSVVALAAAWWQARGTGFGTPMRALPASTLEPAERVETSGAVPAAASEPARQAPRAELPGSTVERRPVVAPAATVDASAAETPGPVPAAQPSPQAPNPPPSLARLRATGVEVPTVRLQLHSYSDNRERRFVFVDGARYGEGEALAAGPRVVRITPTGVVLAHDDHEFLLTVE